MHSYLSQRGYSVVQTIPQDASSRQYYRVEKGGKSFIFMKDNPQESRVGHRICDFVHVARWLRSIGLSAPDIYEVEEKLGFVLLEDLGRTDFRTAIAQGHDKRALYTLGYEVLKFWADKKPDIELPDYYTSRIHNLHRDVIRWYVPAVRGEKNPEGLIEEYWAVWEEVEKRLPSCPKGFMHIDYHVENLMWLSDRKGLQRCGLLDFQAANWGPLPYDLVNLLEDARADVPQDIQADILKGYDDVFKAWYRVLGTQFHCRVIGLFIKLPVQDGKMKYLEHLPRMGRYLRAGLQDPLLKPVQQFFKDWGIDFTVVKDMNIEKIRACVCPEEQS